MLSVTEPDPESPEEKRARVMRRLAEILQGEPPDLSGSGSGAVSAAGGVPELPSDADELDQEAAAELFAALEQFFRKPDRPR